MPHKTAVDPEAGEVYDELREARRAPKRLVKTHLSDG